MVRIILIALMVVSCAIGGTAVDAPSDLDPEYLKRERTMMVDTDRCGPAFIQTKLPSRLVSLIGPVADGPFRPVCGRHDACYRLGEKTQAWCDDRMKDEMLAICASRGLGLGYSVPVVGPASCRFHASLYYGAINSTYGSVAYGDGIAEGEISELRVHHIDDRFSDDEFTVCVDVMNPSKLMQEYDVEMHTSEGKRVDREPDTYEKNVRPGESREFCVSTNYAPGWSVSDLTDTVHISVRADTPETFAFRNDMIVVDTREVRVR